MSLEAAASDAEEISIPSADAEPLQRSSPFLTASMRALKPARAGNVSVSGTDWSVSTIWLPVYKETVRKPWRPFTNDILG